MHGFNAGADPVPTTTAKPDPPLQRKTILLKVIVRRTTEDHAAYDRRSYGVRQKIIRRTTEDHAAYDRRSCGVRQNNDLNTASDFISGKLGT